MPKIKWTNGSGGEWTDGANWTGGNVPGPDDSVIIAVAPDDEIPYTVDLNEDATVKALTLDQTAATLIVDYGATLAAKMKLEAGTLGLYNGTISGLVADTGALLELTSSGFAGQIDGTLQNVTWQGNLMPLLNTEAAYEGSLSIIGGLTLTGAGGKGAGTLTLAQGGVGINFVDTQTLDNATLYLGSANEGLTNTLTSSTDGNGVADLTLGAHLTIDVASNAVISDGNEITNAGTISATGSTTLTINSNSYDNPEFINTGTISIASGAILELGFSTYAGLGEFQNTGTVLDDGTIMVGGEQDPYMLTTSEVEGWNINYGASGTLGLATNGTLDNTGSAIVLGGGGFAPNIEMGAPAILLGGTFTQNGGTISSNGGTFSGVALDGSLSLGGTNNDLTILNGLQIQAGTTLSVTGNNDALIFDSAQTLQNAALVLGSSGGDTLAANASTLALGATVSVEVSGGTAVLGGYYYASTIINDGNINVGAGGFLEIGGSAGPIFTNTGTISVGGDSTLYLDGTITNNGVVSVQDSTVLIGTVSAAVVNSITLSDSTVGIAGTLIATGTTVNVGTGTELGDVVIGLSQPGYGVSDAGIFGGTIHDSGGGLTVEGNVSLTDVTYQGLLSVAATYADLFVSNLTLENANGSGAGTLALSGAGSVLSVAAGTTLDNATIEIGSSINHQGKSLLGPPTIEAQLIGGPLALGAHLIVDQTAKYAAVGELFATGSTDSDATIDAAFKGGQMLLDGEFFISAGAIDIGAQEVVTSLAGSFTNQGSVSIATGGTLSLNLLNYYQLLPDSLTSFENVGQIVMEGGTISEQSGKGIPPVPLRNDAIATISGTGLVAAEVTNYGTVTATGGELTLSQAVSGGGGALDVGGSATLSLLGAVSAGQTANFGGPDGVLGLAAKSFLGEIGGFASGDTIDLLKLKATSAEFSGSSIQVTLSNGSTISLITTQPLSGSLTVTGDGNGGSLISFAGAPHEAAIPPVIAPQLTSAWVQPVATPQFWDEIMHHHGL